MKTDILSKYSFLWASIGFVCIWYFIYSQNKIDLDTILFLIPILYLLWKSGTYRETFDLSEQIIENDNTEMNDELFVAIHEVTNTIESSKTCIDVHYLLGYIQAFSPNKKLRIEEKTPMKSFTIYNKESILFDIEITQNSYRIIAFMINTHYVQIEIQKIEDINIYKEIISTILRIQLGTIIDRE